MNSAVVAWIYGAIAAAGGIMGYVMTLNKPEPSVKSLLAGVASGVALLAAGWGLKRGRRWGLPLAVITIALLLLFFTPRFLASGKFMHNGLMALLGLLTLAVLLANRSKSQTAANNQAINTETWREVNDAGQ